MSEQERHVEAARNRLEETALQYARMKTMGFYSENGRRCIPCYSQVDKMIEYFKEDLLRAAEDLLGHLAMTELPKR